MFHVKQICLLKVECSSAMSRVMDGEPLSMLQAYKLPDMVLDKETGLLPASWSDIISHDC